MHQIHKKRVKFFLIVMVTLGQLGVDLYLPSMPQIAKSLETTAYFVKLTIPMYLLGFGVSQLIYGPISDAWGRKKTLHFGLSIFLLGTLGCFFSINALFLIIFRVIQGLGIGSVIVNVRAIMRDAFHGKEMAKVSSFIAMVWAVIPMIAPAIGGYVETYLGWRANFIIMFLYTGIAWPFLLFFLPETLLEEHKKRISLGPLLRKYIKILSDKVFLSFSVMSALCYSYFISYATTSPFLFQNQLQISPVIYGWFILCIAFGTIFGSMVSNRIVVFVKINHILFIGALMMLIPTIVMFLLSFANVFNIFVLLIPPFLGSIGDGMIFPNCTTGAMTPHKQNAGIAGACFGFVQLSVSFLFSYILSYFPLKNAFPLTIVLATISILVFLLFFLIIRRHFIEEENVSV